MHDQNHHQPVTQASKPAVSQASSLPPAPQSEIENRKSEILFAHHEHAPKPWSCLDDALVTQLHAEARRLYLLLEKAAQLLQLCGNQELESCAICGSDSTQFQTDHVMDLFETTRRELIKLGLIENEPQQYCRVANCQTEVAPRHPHICEHHWTMVDQDDAGRYIVAAPDRREKVLSEIIAKLNLLESHPLSAGGEGQGEVAPRSHDSAPLR